MIRLHRRLLSQRVLWSLLGAVLGLFMAAPSSGPLAALHFIGGPLFYGLLLVLAIYEVRGAWAKRKVGALFFFGVIILITLRLLYVLVGEMISFFQK